MKPGPKPGTYTPSEVTRSKMRASKIGTSRSLETKRKISRSLQGVPKSSEHRNNLSSSLLGLDNKCLRRFEELKAEYPGHEEFFDTHRDEILTSMRDCKSEQELRDLRRYVEVTQVEEAMGYIYPTSSDHAAEDIVVSLLDVKRLLDRISGSASFH